MKKEPSEAPHSCQLCSLRLLLRREGGGRGNSQILQGKVRRERSRFTPVVKSRVRLHFVNASKLLRLPCQTRAGVLQMAPMYTELDIRGRNGSFKYTAAPPVQTTLS